MNWYSRLGLKAKFILFMSLIVLAICSGLFFFIERVFRTYLRSEMQQQAGEIAEALRDQLYNFIDPLRVQNSAERLLSESRELSRITVYRRSGALLEPFIQAETTPLPSNTGLYKTAVHLRAPSRSEFEYKQHEYWEFAYPILNDGVLVGLTTVTLNFSQYKNLIAALRTGTLMILIVGFIAMLISMNLYVEVTMRRPLAEIVAAMNRVKRADFQAKAVPRSQDEIGMVAENFNTMAIALGEAQEEILRQNRILEKRVQEATSALLTRNLDLFHAQDELRRASRLATAGQVAAMLAHDLGSPLSSISGHLQLMLEDQTRSEEDRNRLQLILTQVERLSDTIRNFLKNVTSLESHLQECNLNALIEHLIQLIDPLLAERKIETIIELDRSLPWVMADSNQLQQLFLNLFTNALDAMQQGGQLRVSTRRQQDSAVVKVRDTGAGMSQEHLKNLFRPYFSTKEFSRGTGLGLAICKEIVRAHGGQIQVTSEEGKGTEFTISFPLEPEFVVATSVATQKESK